jgi:hypothetical protein
MASATTTRVTVNAAVKDSLGRVLGLTIETTGSAGYVRIYDGTNTSGTLLFSVVTPAVGANLIPITFPGMGDDLGLKCRTGIYVAVSNCIAVVHHT